MRRLAPSIRNVAACYAGTFAEGAVFLLLTPFLVRELGLAIYGLWGLATALAEWLGLLDFGLREAVMKYTAAHQARSEAGEVRRLADTALFLYSLIALLAILVGGAVAGFGLPLLVRDPANLSTVRAVFLLLALSTAISLPAGIAGSLLEGLARFDVINLFRIGHACLRLVLIVGALQFGTGLTGVAAAELAARIALHICRWSAIRWIDPGLVPSPWPHRSDLDRLLQFGFWSASRQAAEAVVGRLYEPLLAALAGLSSVGAFYAGRRLATTSAEVIVPMAGVLFPLSSEMDAAGRQSALRRTFESTTKIAFMVALPISLVLGLGAGPILTNWLGGRAPEAEPVLRVFSVLFLLNAAALPSEAMILGLGHARVLAILSIVQGVVTVGLGIPLTRVFGPVGLAIAALAGVGLIQVPVLLPVGARRSGIPFPQLMRRAVLPPLIAAAPVAAVLFLLRDTVAVGGLAALAAWAGGGVGAYAVLLWWIGFSDEERALLKSQLNRLVADPGRITDWSDPP